MFFSKFFSKLIGFQVKRVKCIRCRTMATIVVPQPVTDEEIQRIKIENPNKHKKWILTENRFFCPSCDPV